MATAEPWQKAEIPGPKKALVVTKPEVIVALIKRAKRPILIVGHRTAKIEMDDGKLIDYVIRLARTAGIPMVATAHIAGEFIKRGFKPAGSMPALDIANRLKDPEWKGLDGKGLYDLSLFVGLPYYMEWLILSGLKHYAQNLKTVTLDRFYQPHASWSFPTLSVEDWIEDFKILIKNFGEGE